ncbi:MAG: hypothetical protein ABIP94_12615 [Planctomycetota bacterium]
MAIPRTLLAAVLLGGSLLAQTKWNLPLGGLASYSADEELDPDPPRGMLPVCPLPHATILLQSELAADGTHVASEPQDWRWIAPYVAFDLRLLKAGRVRATVPRVPGLGTLEFLGTAASKDERTLVFDLTFEVNEPTLSSDEKKLLGKDPSWYGGVGSGSLQLERTLDAAASVVREFRATLKLDVSFGPMHARMPLRGTFTQHWQLDKVRGYRDPDFAARVAKAIASGADVVEHALRPERPDFATTHDATDHLCGEGRLALALQTLLAAERPADSPKIREGFTELLRRDIRETYSLSVALLATEQAHAPPGERDNLLRGVIDKPAARQLPAAEAARVTEWTERLLKNRDSSVDQAYRARWWYLGGQGFDNSNSQYALLGLWSATLCQQQVPRGVWLAAAEHWLSAMHAPSSKPRGLRLVSIMDVLGKDSEVLTKGATGRATPPRGFGYTLPGAGPTYGSMTCAGIAGMSLCRAALDSGKATALDGKLDLAMRASFAWLAANRTVRWNPGPPPQRDKHFFYWLYSLERACELSRTGLIDDWDWYHEGAQLLLALQDHDGKFGPVSMEEQCFAVLFLKKAQLPVLTGPR